MFQTLRSLVGSFVDTVVGIFRKEDRRQSIPENFVDAVNAFVSIIEKMREADKTYLVSQTSPHNFATALHHNIGRSVRNNWELWIEGSVLHSFMKEKYGISHADDISSVIMCCSWQKMNGLIQTPKVFADAHIQYWKMVEENGADGLSIEIREDGEVIAHPKEKDEQADTRQ